jgi:hypothetical protein
MLRILHWGGNLLPLTDEQGRQGEQTVYATSSKSMPWRWNSRYIALLPGMRACSTNGSKLEGVCLPD